VALFVDREAELGLLEEAYRSGRPELVVVYGRRRLGKTFLIRRFLREHRGLYLVANYSERGPSWGSGRASSGSGTSWCSRLGC